MDASNSVNIAVPVSQQERITLIDSVRGIALLGILLMNIVVFGIPFPAFLKLSVLHEMGTINEKAWFFIEWPLEGTMRAIFSMLFGAGIVLFTARFEKRGEGLLAVDYFMRRQLWLLVFGLVNAFVFLWVGDILFEYAIAGMALFAFRNWSPKKLLMASGVVLMIATARDNRDLYLQKAIVANGEAVEKLDTSVVKLNEKQKDALAEMKNFKESNSLPAQQQLYEKNLRQTSGNYSEVYDNLSDRATSLEFYFGYFKIWDYIQFMFLGMALFKLGILTGKAASKVYWWLFIVGLGFGLVISYYRIQPELFYKFNDYDLAKNVSIDYYAISRTFRSLGIFGLILLAYKSGWFKWLFALTRPVGQMAFTNYLMQSVLCGLFFYGFGLGMMGKLQRYELYYVVAAVWIIEICWSHLWLKYFRFGPLEWSWRSLTYWKIQPMKREIKS
jgi:uncharacterized protein